MCIIKTYSIAGVGVFNSAWEVERGTFELAFK